MTELQIGPVANVFSIIVIHYASLIYWFQSLSLQLNEITNFVGKKAPLHGEVLNSMYIKVKHSEA